MIVAYFDDSFLSGGPVYALGGYVSDAEMFESVLSPAWRSVLGEAPHEVTEFKTSDCRHGKGEYCPGRGWTKEERDSLTTQLVDVITETVPGDRLVGVSTVVVFPGLWKGADARRMDENGFGAAFLDLLQQVHSITMLVREPEETVRVVLDIKPKYKQFVSKYYQLARTLMDESVAKHISPPEFEDSKLTPPLQAADLIAYETMKEARSRWVGGRRPVSKALARLVGARYHYARCITWEQLLEIHRRQQLGPPETMDARDLRPFDLYTSAEPWRAPNHWPFRHGRPAYEVANS